MRAIGVLGVACLLLGCSDSSSAGGSVPAPEGGGGEAGAGGAAGAGAGGEAGEVDAGVDAPSEASLPDTAWGPSFVGAQEHIDGTTPDDVALGIFWDPAVLEIPYDDEDCIAFQTPSDGPVGRDVGDVVIEGGSVVASQALDRDDKNYYLLQSAPDVWAPGDSLSLSVAGEQSGPLTVPSGFASETVSTLTSVSRSGALPIVFSGSNATLIAVSISGGDGTRSLLLVCFGDAAAGSFAVPAAAMSVIPAGVTTVGVKLSPVERIQTGDVAFVVSGELAEAQSVMVAD